MTTPIDPHPSAAEPAAAEPAAAEPAAAEPAATPAEGPPATPAAEPPATPGERIERGAHDLDARAQALGREAEAAVDRLAANPAARAGADLFARAWGLVLLAFGLWFLAAVTFHLALPAISLGDLWPVALILVGVLVLGQGLARRT